VAGESPAVHIDAVSRALFLLPLAIASPAFAQARFFTAIPDLPLPPGYSEIESAIGFDGEHGRLVMAAAHGPAQSGLVVRDFYSETLPQLGWAVSQEGGAVVFQRGRERLNVFIEQESEATELRVQLIVRPASMNAD
jgi:hypothetical protein